MLTKDVGNLVVSRKETESIVIGENIIVTVHKIQGNRVRLQVSAPKDVKVLRSELDEERAA